VFKSVIVSEMGPESHGSCRQQLAALILPAN